MITTIATPRLRLEPLVHAHAEVLFHGLQDARIYQYLDEAPPVSLDALAQRYVRLAARRSPDGRTVWLNWAVASIDAVHYLGYVQATIPNGEATEIAYVFFPSWWRQGYAREAVAAMIASLRSDLSRRGFVAHVHPDNRSSIQLLRHLGFERIGARPTAEGPPDEVYALAT